MSRPDLIFLACLQYIHLPPQIIQFFLVLARGDLRLRKEPLTMSQLSGWVTVCIKQQLVTGNTRESRLGHGSVLPAAAENLRELERTVANLLLRG